MPWPQDMEEVDVLRELVKILEADLHYGKAQHARDTVQKDFDKQHINDLVNHHEGFVQRMSRIKGALLGVMGITKREHRRHCKMNVSLAECNMCYFIGVLEDFLEDGKIEITNLLEVGQKDRETTAKGLEIRRGLR